MNEITNAAAVLGAKGGSTGTGQAKNRGSEHYKKMLDIRWGNQLDRFWSKVDKRGPCECWPWKGWRNDFGYGVLRYNGEEQRAHRVSFLIHNGMLDPNKCVLHRCDNPPCCNPAHLFEGSKHDNTQDMMNKGRHKTVVHRGADNGCAKITADDAVNIRTTYARNEMSQNQLARKFGITQATVWRILHRWIWKHV